MKRRRQPHRGTRSESPAPAGGSQAPTPAPRQPPQPCPRLRLQPPPAGPKVGEKIGFIQLPHETAPKAGRETPAPVKPPASTRPGPGPGRISPARTISRHIAACRGGPRRPGSPRRSCFRQPQTSLRAKAEPPPKFALLRMRRSYRSSRRSSFANWPSN